MSFEESVTTTDRSLGEEEDPTHYTHYAPSTEQDPTHNKHNTPITPSTELYVPAHMSTNDDDDNVAPRYFTRQQAKLQNPLPLPPPDEFTQHVEHAYLTEVTLPSQEVTTLDPLLFLPAPDNWKQILKLPSLIQKHWTNALLAEMKELIKKGTFKHEAPNACDPIIPVTSKYRVKLTPDGTIEKLEARNALGERQHTDPRHLVPYCWIQISQNVLAMASRYKQRIYQLDYVAAFLQADVIGRKFTILPTEWKTLFANNKDVHQWLGVPVLFKKLLYGDRVANLAWDETQSQWLTSSEIGFERLASDGSISVKRSE
jgi:hypothetical protein